MDDKSIKKILKRQVIRTILERSQDIDLVTLGAPRPEDAVKYDNVEEFLNIPYMNRDEVPLALDIFKPIVPAGTELPVLITIHGGGLTMGDRKLSRPYGRLVASKGYLVFSLEYRLAPQVNVCMQLDDVCTGLDLVGRMLVDYDVDFDRIFMSADSSGAFLACYVAAMGKSEKLQQAIGFPASRVSFKAIGLLCGMLYTNLKDPNGWILSEQLYGNKSIDQNFLQYMNPEHPEIINNLPPTYLTTSRGDMLNNYSIMMYEAMKRTGKIVRLNYYGEKALWHAYSTLQTEHPLTVDSIDKMLSWFDEQAANIVKRRCSAEALENKTVKMQDSMSDGSLSKQNIWKYIKERASVNPDRLYAPAIIDCSQTYTYRQMFDQWDKYARAFSAMKITSETDSKVGIAGTISAEPLFAFYALNMTGARVSMFSYPDFLPGGRWKTMLEKEHITDLIISDIMVTPQMLSELEKAKAQFGLRNVILLHTRMGGPSIGPAELLFNEFNYQALKRIPTAVFMNDLIEKYAEADIYTAKYSAKKIALITHTSGTANGTRKPLPYTDRKVNLIADRNITADADLAHNPRAKIAPPFDFSSALNMIGFVNGNLAAGKTIVTTFFGFMHPKFIRAFKYYGVNMTFVSGFMLDRWLETPELAEDEFASLKIIGIGGSYTPPYKMKKYIEFLKKHGFQGTLVSGYGMSEITDAEILRPIDAEEDVLGTPSNPEQFRILDETDGRFYKITDGERTGILYGTSPSMACNQLDGETLFELTDIDGVDYICTNDLVHVNVDGCLSYAGRGNKFFVNNDGVKFESGIVETLLSAQEAIKTCAVVPVLDKRIHDTVPVLYIVPEIKGIKALEALRIALVNLFINSSELENSVLPSQLVLVGSIPCNSNGKVDIYRLTRSRLSGMAFNIVPIKADGKTTDIMLQPVQQLNSFEGGTLPEGMGQDSAFGVFDIFNAPPMFNQYRKFRHETLPQMRKAFQERMGFQMPDMKKLFPNMFDENGNLRKPPEKIMGIIKDLPGIFYNQSYSTKDFDE